MNKNLLGVELVLVLVDDLGVLELDEVVEVLAEVDGVDELVEVLVDDEG